MKIIDFAHYTTVSDPRKIKSDAFIFKCGQGQTIDSSFVSNAVWATRLAKLWGAYWFLDPRFDPIEQADLFCKTILNVTQYPLVLAVDIESLCTKGQPDEWLKLSADEKQQIIFKFLGRIGLYYKNLPLIYVGQYFYRQYLNGVDLSAYPLWVPDYHSDPWEPRLPDCWSKWTIWQKTGLDKEDGLIGYADLDEFNGSIDEFKALYCTPA